MLFDQINKHISANNETQVGMTFTQINYLNLNKKKPKQLEKISQNSRISLSAIMAPQQD